MFLCCGTDKVQELFGEWASGITKDTVENFRALGVDEAGVDNPDPRQACIPTPPPTNVWTGGWMSVPALASYL